MTRGFGSFVLLALIALLSCVGTAAEACPDLSGSYRCTFENTDPQDLRISQSNEGGITRFLFNGNEAIADGQVRVLSDSDELRNGVYRASCSQKMLEVWQKAELAFATGSLESTLQLSRDINGELINVSRGYMVIDGNMHSLDNRGICRLR